MPCSEKSPDPVEKRAEQKRACVVTQAMSKKKETNDKEVTLAETIISQVFKGEQLNSSVSEPV